MYYEINISFNGNHLFATHKRSLRSKDEMIEAYKHLEKKFLKEDGYSITITQWEEIGYPVQIETIQL